MSKTLTEMAAEILAARVRHEAMTSKQIESCLDDTFEALKKLKEKEDAILGNAGQPIITPEKSPQAKHEELEKPEEPPLEPEEPLKPAVQTKKDTMAGTILNLIKSKPKGVDTNYIMEQTGFKKNQVWATVNRAKKKGQIKTTKRGIYVSVKSHKGNK
jgi:predicted Rossmann fold nucleotide-binding protein DprA/Smf involved in DNA uptake